MANTERNRLKRGEVTFEFVGSGFHCLQAMVRQNTMGEGTIEQGCSPYSSQDTEGSNMEGPGAKALPPLQRHFADLLGISQSSQVAGQDVPLAVCVCLA